MAEMWDGWLVQIKPEWLNPGETEDIYVVLEDRDDRILIQRVPKRRTTSIRILVTECVLKDWVNVIDKEIQNY